MSKSSMSFPIRITDHLNYVKSDFAKFKEITARLNIALKQRLNRTAFD